MSHSFGTFEKEQVIWTDSSRIVVKSGVTPAGKVYAALHIQDSLTDRLKTVTFDLTDGRELFRAIGRCLSDMKQVKTGE